MLSKDDFNLFGVKIHVALWVKIIIRGVAGQFL
mgnify:FL=1